MREERLAEKALQGDADALEQLVREQYPDILKYCRWHLPDEQAAQDAAQDTFLKAVRYLDACGSFQGAFRPFLYRIAHNVCIDHLRGVRQDTVSLEALTEPPAYDEAGFTLTEEEFAHVDCQAGTPAAGAGIAAVRPAAQTAGDIENHRASGAYRAVPASGGPQNTADRTGRRNSP